jgi:hypothetical protein
MMTLVGLPLRLFPVEPKGTPMRSVLLASVAAIAVWSPAHSADTRVQREVEDVADTLNSPIAQGAAAGAAGAMMAALLDMPLDGVAKAMEPFDPRKAREMRGRTMRDLATRDDPDFEERIQDGTRAAVGSAGALASAMAVMLPELERTAERMKDAIPRLP